MLYGTEMAHEKVRELLVQFVSENRGSFRPYIDGDIETYLAKMKYTRVWGTAVELLAVAALLQIPVFTLIPHVKYRSSEIPTNGSVISLSVSIGLPSQPKIHHLNSCPG